MPPAVDRMLGGELSEDYEERAAIMEYEGGLSRAEAEARALELARAAYHARHPSPTPEQTQARLLEVEADNAAHAARSREIWPNGKGKRRWK